VTGKSLIGFETAYFVDRQEDGEERTNRKQTIRASQATTAVKS
jgi:hypothetical protein